MTQGNVVVMLRCRMERIIRACLPRAGQIYRDILNRSFIVLRLSDRILVEYADGELKRLKRNEWDKLHPHPSTFDNTD